MINTRVNEQGHSGLICLILKGQLTYMKPADFIRHVVLFLAVSKRISSVLYYNYHIMKISLDRGRALKCRRGRLGFSLQCKLHGLVDMFNLPPR